VPPLRRAFFGSRAAADSTDADDDDGPPLEVVTNALSRLGAAAIPCLMVTLGAALARGPGSAHVSARAVIALIAIRLLVLPTLGAAIVLSLRSMDLWSERSPMFTLVLLLQHAMPSALNIHTVAALHGNHESAVASMLFWQYLACVLTIPACVLVFLSIVV
jgi:auxin efflux carrier family protein